MRMRMHMHTSTVQTNTVKHEPFFRGRFSGGFAFSDRAKLTSVLVRVCRNTERELWRFAALR
jgi:hypothetical protein